MSFESTCPVLKDMSLYAYVFTVKLINVLKENQDRSGCDSHTELN